MRPRARRYPLVASLELTDVESGKQIHQLTRDVSLFGCQAAVEDAFPVGTRVRIRIVHGGASFTAAGRIVDVCRASGTGIEFTRVEEKEQRVLENWISELRAAEE